MKATCARKARASRAERNPGAVPSAGMARNCSGKKGSLQYCLSRLAMVLLIATIVFALLSLRRRTDSRQKALVPEEEFLDLRHKIDQIMNKRFDKSAAINRLGRILSFKTVSRRENPDHLENRSSVDSLLQFLRSEDGFPLGSRRLKWELFSSNLSLLLTWEGSNQKLDPILLISHLDVVPVATKERSSWDYDPFGGIYDNASGYLYGRGALDTKSTAAGPLEAIELLLRVFGTNYRPMRTIILAFGHDEEVGGSLGAAKLAQTLKARNINPKFCLDEGGSVTRGILPGLKQPVALIGVSEKGWCALNITVSSHGGHSSIPSKYGTVVDHASRLILAIRKAKLPQNIDPPVSDLLEYLAPHLPQPVRFLFSNKKVFSGLLQLLARQRDELAAQIGPTFATTMIHGGVAQNVIPDSVAFIQSWRTNKNLKNATHFVERVIQRTPSLLNKLFRIDVRDMGEGCTPPSPISRLDAYFRKVQRYISVAYGTETLSAPFEWLGGTDSKWYIHYGVGERHYRFGPIFLDGNADFQRIHSTNERIHIDTYEKMVRFYLALMMDSE